ncbi:MAG: hypothetical protein GQ532_02945 [Methylomarinum sp.]|nr:hypothetical protein [Methylomarinum sp.]
MSKSSTLIQINEAVPSESYPVLNCSIQMASFVCFKTYQRVGLNVYLQMLAKQIAPFSGTIDYAKPLSIAYIDEEIQLISTLSGLDNLKLAAKYHQLETMKCIDKRAEQLLKQFNCQRVANKLPAFMSNLEKRLLLIARALMLNPDVLFIEKPFQGLNRYEHNILGDHLISLLSELKITIICSDTTLGFTKKAAQQIIYCDDKVFYDYNQWEHFKKNHNELFTA